MGELCRPSAVEQEKLEQWIAAHGTPQQVALRCRIVAAAAAGKSDVAIAEQLSVNRNTVILWRKRFAEEGLDGLCDDDRVKTEFSEAEPAKRAGSVTAGATPSVNGQALCGNGVTSSKAGWNEDPAVGAAGPPLATA